jgi:hypothetical protein
VNEWKILFLAMANGRVFLGGCAGTKHEEKGGGV